MTFDEWKNRKRYGTLDPDVLGGIDTGLLAQTIVDHIEDVRLAGLERGGAQEYARVEALPENLRRIGAAEHAELVARAVAIHDAEKPAFDKAQNSWTPDKAFSQLAKTSKLRDLDDQYYALKIKLEPLIDAYALRVAPTIYSP